MVDGRLSRDDWIRGDLEAPSVTGAGGVRVAPLAERMGVTSGSFYWHFKNRRELHRAVFDYWERELTDVAIIDARGFQGPPEQRIWSLMDRVMTHGLARHDLTIWQLSLCDQSVRLACQKTLNKRFDFARWMFTQAGFDQEQAEARGRLMVVYLMEESRLTPEPGLASKEQLRVTFEILVN